MLHRTSIAVLSTALGLTAVTVADRPGSPPPGSEALGLEQATSVVVPQPIVDEAGRLLGVFALQVPIERIQETMQFSEGMGRTGETYLVGRDHVMRSDSRFGAEPTTLDTRVETEAVRRALEGESGVALTSDFRGVEVLSAYAPFAMDGIDWAVIAEIDEEEVYEAVVDLRLSVPLLGFALYALAVLTLWILDPSGWVARDLEDLDVGEMPAP